MSIPRSMQWLLCFASLAALPYLYGRGTHSSAQQVASSLPPPVHLTAEQDHQRLMDLLHIASFRRGPDGDPNSPNAAHYDESKATPPQNLPDPLKLNDGKPVTSAKMWWNQRRPEIVEAFDREILGRVPKNTPAVTWQVTSTTTKKNGDVSVITKNLLGHVDNSSYLPISVDIQLTLTPPANATGPVPVIMELSWSAEAMAAIRKRFTAAQVAALAD